MADSFKFVIAISCVAFVAACGDAPFESRSGFESDLAKKYCAQYFECEGSEPYDAFYRSAYTEASCARYEIEEDPFLDAYIAAGTVEYDKAAGKACLESFSDLCAGGDVPECDRIYVGVVPAGSGCEADIQCASGACTSPVGNACGVCLAPAANGASCANGEPCLTGSVCRSAVFGGPRVCTPFVSTYSVVQAELGESCEGTDNVEVECAPGLYCDANERCATRLAAGLRCDSESDSCAYGTICVETVSDEIERCVPITTTTTVGADCDENATGTGFVICDRAARLYCGEDSTCVRIGGDGKLGSECYGDRDCKVGRCAYLGDDNFVCVAGDLPNGSVCTTDEVCESGYCDRVDGQRHCAAIETCN